jgi:hypothetical protein
MTVGAHEHVTAARHLIMLKRLVLSSAEPSEPLDYFSRHVAGNPQLEHASTPAAPKMLVSIIQALLAAHFGQSPPAVTPSLRFVPSHHFWYGDCLSGSHQAHLLYFDDVATGLLSVIRSPESDVRDCLRFSVIRRNRRPTLQ